MIRSFIWRQSWAVALIVAAAVLLLDLYSQSFRRLVFSVTKSTSTDPQSLSFRTPDHDEVIDHKNLYEAGLVRKLAVRFETKSAGYKFSKLPFTSWMLARPGQTR